MKWIRRKFWLGLAWAFYWVGWTEAEYFCNDRYCGVDGDPHIWRYF